MADGKKHVGFAPAPVEDLREHHLAVRAKEELRKTDNSFHKIPPELAYLQKRNQTEGPKMLPLFVKPRKPLIPETRSVQDISLGDLKQLHIKSISVQNKDTEVNVNYPVIDRPIAAHKIMVDVKYAGLNTFDFGKLPLFNMNVSDVQIGLGCEYVGEIQDLGKNYTAKKLNFELGQKVFGIVNPLAHQGALSTSILVNPQKDVIIPIEDADLKRMLARDVVWRLNSDDGDFELDDDSVIPETEPELDIVEAETDPESVEADADAETEPVDIAEAGVEPESVDIVEPEPEPEPEGESVAEAEAVDSEEAPADDSALSTDPLQLPVLSKFAAFSVQYLRARAALEKLPTQLDRKINILINGADTQLGIGILQLLNSLLYNELLINVILIVRDSHLKEFQEIAEYFSKGKYFNPSLVRKYSVISFDVENKDIILPGETVPVVYKKATLLAGDVLNAMFTEPDHSRLIDKESVDLYKLDFYIDIAGGKMLHLVNVLLKRLEESSFPWLSRISSQTTLSKLFPSSKNGEFLLSILKPKGKYTGYVACCNQSIIEPSYSVKDTIVQEATSLWNTKWTSGFANSYLSSYNYYENIGLKVKPDWVKEGLEMVLNGEFKPVVDKYVDWREKPRVVIDKVKRLESKVLFKVEDF